MSSPTAVIALEPPRFETGRPLVVAGLKQEFLCSSAQSGIPLLWQRFAPHIGRVPGQKGGAAYGVFLPVEQADSFEYLAGVEVADAASLPAEFASATVEPGHYAVFRHHGPVSDMCRTAYAIWCKWIPESGYEPVRAPHFEFYPEDFDPHTSTEGVEIWLPVKEKQAA